MRYLFNRGKQLNKLNKPNKPNKPNNSTNPINPTTQKLSMFSNYFSRSLLKLTSNVRKRLKAILNFYPRWICKREFEQQSFVRFNERPVEYGFVFKQISRIYPRKVLDVGTGTTALPHLMHNCGLLVTAIDNVKDYWPSEMCNRHFHVIDDDITDTRINGSFDLVTCISVLEHIEEFEAAIKNMFNFLDPTGFLILTFPYSEKKYIRNVYRLSGSSYGQDVPYITQSFSRAELSKWLRDNDGEIIEQEYWQFWDGHFWTVGNQIIPPQRVEVEEKHQISCILIQKKNGIHMPG